jgi:hypothetical protein
MRLSIHRRKDIFHRSVLLHVTDTPTNNLTPEPPMRNCSRVAHLGTYSVPMRRIHRSDFNQQWPRFSAPLYHHTRLLAFKFNRQGNRTMFRWKCDHNFICNWMWSAPTEQELRNILHSWQHSRRFSNANDGTRSKSKRQQNYELSGKRIATDPFATLGIVRSPALKYASVKSIFLKIAMKYHPDTTAQCTDAERETNKDLFVSARKAFESIIANPDGIAILKTEADDYVEEEDDFEEWFKTETGYDIPFMDAATMKEVAEMTDTVGGGLDRDGGMWTLARMVANTVKEGGDSKSVLQLDAGIIRDRAIDGILRRRRKR